MTFYVKTCTMATIITKEQYDRICDAIHYKAHDRFEDDILQLCAFLDGAQFVEDLLVELEVIKVDSNE